MTTNQEKYIYSVVDDDINAIFLKMVDRYNLKTGDISPHNAVALDQVKDILSKILIEYVNNNKR